VAEIGEKLLEGGPRVGQSRFADELTGSIQDADVMLPVTEIQTEGEPAADGSGRSGNKGRSSVCFHRQSSYTQRNHCAGRLPSHLIWLGGWLNIIISHAKRISRDSTAWQQLVIANS